MGNSIYFRHTNRCSCESIKVFEKENISTWGGLKTPKLRIHAECFNHLNSQGQTFVSHVFGYWFWRYSFWDRKFLDLTGTSTLNLRIYGKCSLYISAQYIAQYIHSILTVPYLCWEIVEDVNLFKLFISYNQHTNKGYVDHVHIQTCIFPLKSPKVYPVI